MRWRFLKTSSLLLRQHRRYRGVQKRLNSQITEEYLSPEIIHELADWFGFLQSKTLTLEDEDEMDIMNDFFLYEFRDPENRRTVELARIDYVDEINDEQIEVLAAMCQSETVLLQVRENLSNEGELQTNCLRGSLRGKTMLIDQGLSTSLAPDMVLFGRIISFPKFSMTSGAVFVFDSVFENHALRVWDRAVKDYPSEPKQTQFLWRRFLYLNRDVGLKVNVTFR